MGISPADPIWKSCLSILYCCRDSGVVVAVVSDEVFINCASAVTITPPATAPPGQRFIFPNYDPALHVLNVAHVPDWFAAGDYIEYRKRRIVAVSLTQTEPRWRAWARKVASWLLS